MATHSHTGWPCKICGYPVIQNIMTRNYYNWKALDNQEYAEEKAKAEEREDLDKWFEMQRKATKPNNKTMREGPIKPEEI